MKLILGKRPDDFFKQVTFTRLNGDACEIGCKFKFRTVTELGELVDAHTRSDDGVLIATIEGGQAEVNQGRVQASARYLADILVEWDLESPLNHENLVLLCNLEPAARVAIASSYAAAINDGRLGN